MDIRKLLLTMAAFAMFAGCATDSPSVSTVDGMHVYWGEAVEGFRAGIAFKGVCHTIALTPYDLSDNAAFIVSPSDIIEKDNSASFKCMCANTFRVIIENNSCVLQQAPWEFASMSIQLSCQNTIGCGIMSKSVESLFKDKLSSKWYTVGVTRDDLYQVAKDTVIKQASQREYPVRADIEVHLRSSKPLDNAGMVTKSIHFETGSVIIPFQVKASMRTR